MKKIIILPAVISIALMSSQAYALSYLDQFGVGNATPGATRDTSGSTTNTTDTTNTTNTTNTDTAKGNGKGKGKGKGGKK